MCSTPQANVKMVCPTLVTEMVNTTVSHFQLATLTTTQGTRVHEGYGIEGLNQSAIEAVIAATKFCGALNRTFCSARCGKDTTTPESTLTSTPTTTATSTQTSPPELNGTRQGPYWGTTTVTATSTTRTSSQETTCALCEWCSEMAPNPACNPIPPPAPPPPPVKCESADPADCVVKKNNTQPAFVADMDATAAIGIQLHHTKPRRDAPCSVHAPNDCNQDELCRYDEAKEKCVEAHRLLMWARYHQDASDSNHELSRAPYVLYGVKYIDLVFLHAVFRPQNPRRSGSSLTSTRPKRRIRTLYVWYIP